MLPEDRRCHRHYRTEVIFDSGIRTGQDVLRALALGAKSCMIGRAYIYGLGAGGQAGVTKAIEVISNELSVTRAGAASTGWTRSTITSIEVPQGGQRTCPVCGAGR